MSLRRARRPSPGPDPSSDTPAPPPRGAYLVRADRPLVMRRPVRKLMIAYTSAVLVAVACAVAGGWLGGTWANDRSNAHTNAVVKSLDQDRRTRTKQRDQQNQALQDQINADRAAEQADICAAIAHQPSDKGGPVDRLRLKYRCPAYTPAVAPSASPSGTARPPAGSGPAGDGDGGVPSTGSGPPAGGRPPGGGHPPTTPPQPSPSPPAGGGDCLLPLPLIGCLF